MPKEKTRGRRKGEKQKPAEHCQQAIESLRSRKRLPFARRAGVCTHGADPERLAQRRGLIRTDRRRLLKERLCSCFEDPFLPQSGTWDQGEEGGQVGVRKSEVGRLGTEDLHLREWERGA